MISRSLTLNQTRVARDAAKTAFHTRLEQVKADLAARSIGGRVADKLGEEAVDALDYTVDVARDSKGIIAGTLAAIVLWLFRNPIIAWAEGLFNDETGEEEESENDDRSED
ncbi:MAG TPA: hypothetical protein VF470_01415 [Sphingomicrobium sp.]